MSGADREKWDGIYGAGPPATLPSPWLASLDALLPREGRAIDVAGGAGRNAIWLARRGLDVTLADISEVGLAIARAEAGRAGVALRTVAVDLEADPLPEGPWDLVLSFHYLHRPLYPALIASLAPGGLLLVDHPTRSNLARHPKPSARFLLEDGELPALVEGLAIERYEEGWLDEGRHEARLVARKI